MQFNQNKQQEEEKADELIVNLWLEFAVTHFYKITLWLEQF